MRLFGDEAIAILTSKRTAASTLASPHVLWDLIGRISRAASADD